MMLFDIIEKANHIFKKNAKKGVYFKSKLMDAEGIDTDVLLNSDKIIKFSLPLAMQIINSSLIDYYQTVLNTYINQNLNINNIKYSMTQNLINITKNNSNLLLDTCKTVNMIYQQKLDNVNFDANVYYFVNILDKRVIIKDDKIKSIVILSKEEELFVKNMYENNLQILNERILVKS